MSTNFHYENQLENQLENRVRIQEPPNTGKDPQSFLFFFIFVLDIFDLSITKIFNQSLDNPKIDILLSPPFGLD
jgi:hypothetical protein